MGEPTHLLQTSYQNFSLIIFPIKVEPFPSYPFQNQSGFLKYLPVNIPLSTTQIPVIQHDIYGPI